VVDVLPVIAAILLLGIGAQLLARRLRVPSVLFLIAIGLALGPELLGLVTLETFGEGLRVIVGLSVAIIVFDGAFDLRIDRLREASRTTIRLSTVGALLTFLGTAGAVRLFLDASWSLSLLVGALLVATGPTVITPILEVVRVREHVAAALESEGIVNDVTAAIGAVVIYETLVVGEGDAIDTLAGFSLRFAVGIGVGLLVASTVYLLLTHEIAPGDAPQVARFLTLSAALGSFALADLLAAEAGIAAAATAGIVLGNLELPHRETMEVFGRDLTLVVLSFVFISLAALIDVEAILALGLGGVGVVLAVVLVIRPIVMWICARDRRFTDDERLFLAAVGPRGIVPASVATLFAIELAVDGDPTAAGTLVGTVFLIIFVTVVLEAGLARQIADALSVTPMRTIIVGGGRVGRALATRLERRGEFVVVVDRDDGAIAETREAGFTVHAGDGTDPSVLRAAGADDAKIVVAATSTDDVNLLISQLARTTFGVERVFARVNDPENVPAFDTLDVQAIDASMATARVIDNEIERPALTHWMAELGEGHDVQEIEVTAEDLAGRTIREVNAEIPDGCIVAVVGREGDTHVPRADDRLERGDHVTFVGETSAVAEAVARFHPHD
jgi:NhaP-type Na+/H+ or K+/H+ antiporter